MINQTKEPKQPRSGTPPAAPKPDTDRLELIISQAADLSTVEPEPSLADRLLEMNRESHRKRKRGELPRLGVNPATGKRFQGTGRYPTSGLLTPILKHEDAPRVSNEGRFRSRRERAMELQARMAQFSSIYNAGYLVRDSYFGPEKRQREAVMKFLAALIQELRATQDYEACLFAVADALYASKLGTPWEP